MYSKNLLLLAALPLVALGREQASIMCEYGSYGGVSIQDYNEIYFCYDGPMYTCNYNYLVDYYFSQWTNFDFAAIYDVYCDDNTNIALCYEDYYGDFFFTGDGCPDNDEAIVTIVVDYQRRRLRGNETKPVKERTAQKEVEIDGKKFIAIDPRAGKK